jgi:hypothetical protein
MAAGFVILLSYLYWRRVQKQRVGFHARPYCYLPNFFVG